MVLPQEKRLVEKKIVGGNHLRVLYWTAGGVLLQLDLPSAISTAMLASGATQRSICSIRFERICRKCLAGWFLYMFAKLKQNINLSPISIYLLTGLLGLLSCHTGPPKTCYVKKNCPSSKGAMLLSWRVPPQGTKISPHPSRHFPLLKDDDSMHLFSQRL